MRSSNQTKNIFLYFLENKVIEIYDIYCSFMRYMYKELEKNKKM